MPATGVTTLLEIRTSCKEESDNVNESFLSDAEWDRLINKSAKSLYGKIVEAFGNDYFTQGILPYSFTTDGTNSYFALPDGTGTFPAFFKLLGVDLGLQGNSNQYVPLKPFAFADRNLYSGLFNQSVPPAGQTIRVFYVPRFVDLVGDSATFDGFNGWEDWIVCEAAMSALAKEESDTSVFAARLAALQRRLETEIEHRDAANPARIVDSMGMGAAGMMYRLNGNKLWLIGSGTPGWHGDWGGSTPRWL